MKFNDLQTARVKINHSCRALVFLLVGKTAGRSKGKILEQVVVCDRFEGSPLSKDTKARFKSKTPRLETVCILDPR